MVNNQWQPRLYFWSFPTDQLFPMPWTTRKARKLVVKFLSWWIIFSLCHGFLKERKKEVNTTARENTFRLCLITMSDEWWKQMKRTVKGMSRWMKTTSSRTIIGTGINRTIQMVSTILQPLHATKDNGIVWLLKLSINWISDAHASYLWRGKESTEWLWWYVWLQILW